MGDVGKELPEDVELENLVDMDIPGLVAPGERSFDFVEAEVREQLSHLSSRASVAQLVRARDCQSLGRRFDSV